MIRYSLNMDIAPFDPALDYRDAVVFTGSCFSDHMANRLKEAYFSVFAQPCGVVFNPLSLAEPFLRALQTEDFTEQDLIQHNGLWHSVHHHGSFSETNKQDLLRKANHTLHAFKRSLHAARFLFVTFGSAWIYELKERHITVANCHKIPQDRFAKRLAEPEEIVGVWDQVMRQLRAFNHNLIPVFTVSPVKHLRDGVVENALSKAVLITALHKLRSLHADIRYFPAYELVSDDLRDYRFYENDGAHPNTMAIDYVFEKFRETVFNEQTRTYYKDLEQYLRMSRHRLLREDGEEYLHFMRQLEARRQELNSRYDLEL